MSRQNIFKVIFLSLILSSLTTSCGLIDKWKTPEQPTDSKETSEAPKNNGSDDLFAQTLDATKPEAPPTVASDAPSNITQTPENPPVENKAPENDLKSLEDEFAGNTTATTAKEVAAAPEVKPEVKSETKEVKVEEALPQISEEAPAMADATNPNAGKVLKYKVHKGETLMQIAFKIYGDISKWKDLKQMNGRKISSNTALMAKTEIMYTAPDKEFVWNPVGTPYMIKTGDTLGVISNNVYQTPKKWKKIWENNKPLIKNPNVIFAGFTLYYKADGMANYVQPKAIQKISSRKKAVILDDAKIAEEVKVEEAISKIDNSPNDNEIDLTKNVQSAAIRNINDEVKADEQVDEALVK